MLITRRSRKRLFESDFRSEPGEMAGAFTARQYRRCREELAGAGLHAAVLVMLGIALLVFGHRLWRLFHQHAGGIQDPWMPRLLLGAVAVAAVLVFWRLSRKMLRIKHLKAELIRLRSGLTQKTPEA